MTYSKVIILGGSGFIGGNLARHLKDFWHQSRFYILSSADYDLLNPSDCERLGSILDDQTALFICAGLQKKFGDTVELLKNNILMIAHLVELLKRNRVGYCCYFSTSGVYGEGVDLKGIHEEFELRPMSYYSTSKLAGEYLLKQVFSESTRDHLLIVRPTMVYGLGERIHNYGPASFLKNALKGDPIVLWGDGTETRDFIYVRDLVRLVRLTAERHVYGTLNLASGKAYSFQEICSYIADIVKNVVVENKQRTLQKVSHSYDNRKLSACIKDIEFSNMQDNLRIMYQELVESQ